MRKPTALFLVLFSLLLIWQFLRLDVLQDDAFISFRYIRNFLDGFGLVFNLGERVEGYTNFFWIILLALLAKLGLPLIETARAVGVLGAVGTLGICVYAAQRYYPQRDWLWIAAAPLLLAANGALAYWAGSGLETGLFTFLAAAAAVTYLSRPTLSLLLLVLAALTRPEGALLAFLFGLAGIILKEKSWKTTLVFWGSLALLLFPYAVFKWFYYGSLLPNPFYAKTGFSLEYLQSGLEYVGLFLQHYGGYGLFLLLPLFFWKKLSTFSRFCLLVFSGYTLYLVAIGGDVLKAHRFFVPILIFFYLPVMDGLYNLFEKVPRKNLVFALAALLVSFLAYHIPKNYLRDSAETERGLVAKMENLGRLFVQYDYAKSFATSTIGALSYYVGKRRVIDMLGLTELEIARNPEKIDGLASSWKEKHFNTRYLLSQRPEVIIFSTELKPSSSAERALFLYPEFRRNYRLEYLFGDGRLSIFYRKFKDYAKVTGPDQPAAFANQLNAGLNMSKTDTLKAAQMLKETLAFGPKDCSALYIMAGGLCTLAGLVASSEEYLQKGLALDGGGSLGQWYYITLLNKLKRSGETIERLNFMIRSVPTAEEFLRARGVLQDPPSGRAPLNVPNRSIP